eukprot:IDg783t1
MSSTQKEKRKSLQIEGSGEDNLRKLKL